MNTLVIQAVRICDSNRNPLPYNPATGAYQCIFTPIPLGSTGKLFLEVTCDLDTLATAQIRCALTLFNQTGQYFFVTNDKFRMLFYREASTNQAIYLPFELTNQLDLGMCLDARMRLDVQFASVNDGTNRPHEWPTIHGNY